MVLGALAAGAGLGVAGGLLSSSGKRKQARAQRRAFQRRKDQLQRRDRDTRAITDDFRDRMGGMSDQYQQLNQRAIQGFGGAGQVHPGDMQQAQNQMMQARQRLQRFMPKQMGRRHGQQFAPGMEQQAMQQEAARFTHRNAAQQSALARALAGARDMDSASEMNADQMGLNRDMRDVQFMRALQNAEIDRRAGFDAGANALFAARNANAGNSQRALGGFVSSLAPAAAMGLASMGSPELPAGETPAPDPDYFDRIPSSGHPADIYASMAAGRT